MAAWNADSILFTSATSQNERRKPLLSRIISWRIHFRISKHAKKSEQPHKNCLHQNRGTMESGPKMKDYQSTYFPVQLNFS